MTGKKLISALCFALCIVFSFTGCLQSNTSGNTVDEPEITVDYLTGEYRAQLIRDGAVHHFGSLSVSRDKDGAYSARIEIKKLVESPEHENGYYIADRNVSMTLPCSPEARVTVPEKGRSTPKIVTVEQLVSGTEGAVDGENVYDIYEIGGSVELILAADLK